MSTATLPMPGRNFVLHQIPWSTYVTIGELLKDQNVRMNYDRGVLEFMVTSPEHEFDKKRLARLVEALTEEMGMEIASFGSMTCRSEEIERGMEPDECYWIANEPAVRGRRSVNLDTDPPPDLAVEIEISRSVVKRLPILASLGVPEVWRWDGDRVRVLLLNEQGTYAESTTSSAFPFLPIAELGQFLVADPTRGENELMRAFRAWVRERFLPAQ